MNDNATITEAEAAAEALCNTIDNAAEYADNDDFANIVRAANKAANLYVTAAGVHSDTPAAVYAHTAAIYTAIAAGVVAAGSIAISVRHIAREVAEKK